MLFAGVTQTLAMFLSIIITAACVSLIDALARRWLGGDYRAYARAWERTKNGYTEASENAVTPRHAAPDALARQTARAACRALLETGYKAVDHYYDRLYDPTPGSTGPSQDLDSFALTLFGEH